MIKALTAETITRLQQHELFTGFQSPQVKQILEAFTTVSINGGDTVITAGQTDVAFYFIVQGSLRVHLLSDQTNPVIVLTTGQSIGEMTMIDHQAATANIIADTDCLLLSISKSDFWQLLSQHHQLAINMLSLVSNRLRNSHSMFERIKGLVRDVEQNALIDPLTNLYNRRWLDDMLPRMIQRTMADDLPMAVIMLDIDYFKQFNDQHGHLAGDRALQSLAIAIKENIRPEDFVTRYGGEEFFIILPGLELTAAFHIAERLRSTTTQLVLEDHSGNALPGITISLGLAELKEQQTIESLIDQADNALYQAKTLGRNQVFSALSCASLEL